MVPLNLYIYPLPARTTAATRSRVEKCQNQAWNGETAAQDPYQSADGADEMQINRLFYCYSEHAPCLAIFFFTATRSGCAYIYRDIVGPFFPRARRGVTRSRSRRGTGAQTGASSSALLVTSDRRRIVATSTLMAAGLPYTVKVFRDARCT